jgi:hypothetical protein
MEEKFRYAKTESNRPPISGTSILLLKLKLVSCLDEALSADKLAVLSSPEIQLCNYSAWLHLLVIPIVRDYPAKFRFG